MRERLPCEFFLIRYVPDVVRGEFANIGLVLREAGQPATSVVRFTRDWTRVRCIDADADTALLEALEDDLGSRLKSTAAGTKPLLDLLEDTMSNSVQISGVTGCLAESLPAELDQLMRLYVETSKARTERRRTGRAAIAARMRREFERVGVWGLMRKRIPASMYTEAGDPMRLDCGYRPNGVIRMFQAVSLEGDVEAAKVLAYSASRLREGVRRVEGAELELTAVVEPLRELREEAESTERYRFGVVSMEREQIRVLTVNDIGRAADRAQVELRL